MTQTIEQLTARVAELEKKNVRLKETLVDHGEIQKSLCENLSASQAYAEQLREALGAALFTMEEIWREGIKCLSSSDLREAKEALAIPRDTKALDAYVKQKIKEYN